MYVCATDLGTAHCTPLDTYIPAAQVLCSNLHLLYQPLPPSDHPVRSTDL